MLASEDNARRQVCIWIQEKIKLFDQINTISLQRCGQKSVKTQPFISNVVLELGLQGEEHTSLGRLGMIKMRSLDADKKSYKLKKRKREKSKLKEECTQRKAKISTSSTMNSKLGD